MRGRALTFLSGFLLVFKGSLSFQTSQAASNTQIEVSSSSSALANQYNRPAVIKPTVTLRENVPPAPSFVEFPPVPVSPSPPFYDYPPPMPAIIVESGGNSNDNEFLNLIFLMYALKNRNGKNNGGCGCGGGCGGNGCGNGCSNGCGNFYGSGYSYGNGGSYGYNGYGNGGGYDSTSVNSGSYSGSSAYGNSNGGGSSTSSDSYSGAYSNANVYNGGYTGYGGPGYTGYGGPGGYTGYGGPGIASIEIDQYSSSGSGAGASSGSDGSSSANSYSGSNTYSEVDITMEQPYPIMYPTPYSPYPCQSVQPQLGRNSNEIYLIIKPEPGC